MPTPHFPSSFPSPQFLISQPKLIRSNLKATRIKIIVKPTELHLDIVGSLSLSRSSFFHPLLEKLDMAEEFEESEVIFPDQDEYNKIGNFYLTTHGQGLIKPKKQRKSSSNNVTKADRGWDSTTGSLPVDIKPSNLLRLAGYHQDYCEYDGGELVPPHIIVGRRIAGKMAFSVCTGKGRTLKGRDLSQVRNSILRLTGFLET